MILLKKAAGTMGKQVSKKDAITYVLLTKKNLICKNFGAHNKERSLGEFVIQKAH